MRKVKKLIAGIAGIFLAVGMITPIPVKAEGLPIQVTTPGNAVLTYKYNEPQDFVLNLENTGSDTYKNLTISPRLRDEDNNEKWPFKTEYQSYFESVAELAPGPDNVKSVKFTFTERDEVPNGRFVLAIDVSAEKEGGSREVITEYFYVNTTAKPAPPKEENKGNNNENNNNNNNGGGSGNFSDMDFDPGMAGAGGYSNGGASYSGGGSEGGSEGSGSVPRVIVTGFNTQPAQVKAGGNFTLIIHLKNTSKATKVQNMLFDLAAPTEGNEQTAAPAFLPASGSNSVYLDGIGADGTADISIQLNAKADLVQKPYSINLSMKYEDSKAAQIDAASSISIPVKQDARFEFSDFDITSETIAVDEESNVSCSLYNLGRIKLYNVKAVFEGEGVKKEELFVGNVEPGATASIDAMLTGKKAVSGAKPVKMTLSYEDEAGTKATAQKELQLEVTEAADQETMAEMMPVEQKKSFPIVPVAAGAGAVALVSGVVIVRKRKKKKLMLAEEEGLMDEVDRPSEDE